MLRPTFPFLLVISLLLTACTFQVTMLNPATIHCAEQGGQIELAISPQEIVGICAFADGSVCDEWAFLDESCVPGQHLPTYTQFASSACTQAGAMFSTITGQDGSEYEVCNFGDSVCDAQSYFDGSCVPGQNLFVTEQTATLSSENPAILNCFENEGTPVTVQAGDGGEYGLCYFPDATLCEAESLLNGTCAPGENFQMIADVMEQPAEQQSSNRPANPASVNCLEQGGLSFGVHARDGSEYGLCQLPSGKFCEEWAFFREECRP